MHALLETPAAQSLCVATRAGLADLLLLEEPFAPLAGSRHTCLKPCENCRKRPSGENARLVTRMVMWEVFTVSKHGNVVT